MNIQHLQLYCSQKSLALMNNQQPEVHHLDEINPENQKTTLI